MHIVMCKLFNFIYSNNVLKNRGERTVESEIAKCKTVYVTYFVIYIKFHASIQIGRI